MAHPTGASELGDDRVGFDRRVRLEFHGSKISSDGGLLLFRELDDVLGLHTLAGEYLSDTRTGHNRLHNLVGLLRQSAFGIRSACRRYPKEVFRSWRDIF